MSTRGSGAETTGIEAAAVMADVSDTELEWLEARLMRRRTPDFSSSNSSIDSFEVTISMISFSSLRFIKDNHGSIADKKTGTDSNYRSASISQAARLSSYRARP